MAHRSPRALQRSGSSGSAGRANGADSALTWGVPPALEYSFGGFDPEDHDTGSLHPLVALNK
jgi:hypothetical protein